MTTTATLNVKRLNDLARLLEQVPADKFNMDVWLDTPDAVVAQYAQPAPHLGGEIREVDADVLVQGCGTAGCAMGWATTLPEFRERYRLQTYEFSDASFGSVYPMGKRDDGYDLCGFYDCGKDFFGLNGQQASFLFSPSTYLDEVKDDDGNYVKSEHITAQRVANRIRLLIKHPGIYDSEGAFFL